jgi:hypothetical protein
VARLVPARLDILLLADQAVTPARLLAEQATIAELLRELPVGTAVRLDVAGRFVGGSPTEALGRLAALAPRDSSFDALVRQAVRGWRPAGVPALARAVVLVAGCPTLARLSAGLRSRARGRGQLAFLGLGHGCPAAGGALFSVSAATSNQPIVAASADAAAADRLAARFLGEYELDVATAAGHRLSLVVQALGTTRTASVIVPRAGRTATSRRSAVGHRQAGSASWLDALAAGLVALVALGVAAGVQRLHRQRRQRSGRPSTTRLSA